MREHDSLGSAPGGTPDPTRQYIISSEQVRSLAVMGSVGMVVALVALLFLATARPQGRFERLDTSEFQQAVASATADLEGYELLDNGRARIDIDRAMELVAERGVAAPGILSATAAAAGTAQPADTGDAAAGDASADTGAVQASDIDGAAAYAPCAACHMANGMGLPGAFPPLAGHAPELYVADRTYPILVLLYGVMGQIQVDGTPYNGLMPAHGHLGDAELAAILNHVMTAFGNEELLPDDFTPFEAADVAAERGRNLSFTDVYALRSELGLP